MNGFITRAAGLMACAAAAAAGGGCYYRDVVDPCWPERYNYLARQEVNGAMAPQVQNGHVLDQTVWNYHFEVGSDKLTAGGLEHVAYLARRRPCPDPVVYVQTAQDVLYDAATPAKLQEVRQDLDAKRVAAVHQFLMAQTVGRPTAFEVLVHDPAETGISGVFGNAAANQLAGRARGGLGTGTGGSTAASAATGTGGASATGGAGTTGSR
jgi:hypothetical protein